MDPSIETSASPSAPASASHHDDNEDLDPAKFLKSIRELSERREREDLERFRKLEEEVETSRAERARKKLQVEAVGAGATPAHVYSPSGVNQQHLYTERRPSISPNKARSAHEVLSATSARSESVLHTPPPPPPRPLSPYIAPLNPAMETNLAGPPSPTKDIPEFKGFSSARASNTPSAPPSAQPTDPASSRPSPSASTLARSGTLSWQQRRPQSRGASRPVSVVGSEESGLARDASRASRPTSGVGSEDTGHRGNASRASRPTSGVGSEDTGHTRNASLDQPEPSRDQIAASLGSRDPAWFRQTAERGTGSAAYRKSKDEASTGQGMTSSRRVLPGLARDTATEPSGRASPTPTENARSEVASTPTSARDSGIASSRVSATPSNSTQSKADLKSLLAEDEAQRQASPMSDQTPVAAEQHTDLSRNLSMSTSQARLASAAERPSSPTKGMGGFVQSAMMKRSDSVSKRWSAQPGASLSRQNSTVSTRSGYNGLQGSRSMPRLEPTPSSREASNEPASRPTSSSSNLAALTQQREGDDMFVKPALPHHSRSKSVASTYSTTADDKTAASPPSSPSKRFSPAKSSWIESALTKPESPKPSTARNAQPGWMANIAKAKAERASAESTPRTGTPRPPGEEGSRPASPVKSASAPFGPSLLRSASSRSLAAGVRSSTPPLMKTPVAMPREVAAADVPTPSYLTEPSKADGMEVSVPQVEPTPERPLSNARTLTAPQSEQTPERLLDATKTPTAPRSETQQYSARPTTLEPRPAAAKPALELPSSRSFVSPSPSTSTKAKPEISNKPKPKPETAPIPEQPLENAQTHTTSHADTHDSTARSVTGPPGAAAAKPAIELPSSRFITSPSPSTPTKVKPEFPTKEKPETPAKPQTDFRNTLRSRPAGETKSTGTPEFLSKFGQLRKTQPEKYVAPDVLRDNITRGKAELARTGGPVKTLRRDELKESLLAKKEDWKKAKEEGRELPGQVHERKTSAGVPVTPPKPEALAKREWLGRPEGAGRMAAGPEKGRGGAPEALSRQRTVREEVKPEPAQAEPPTIAPHDHATSEPLSKQQSAPAVIEHIPAPATAEPSSRLAARFNPGLAGLLARGPPGSANTSNAPSRSGSPVVPQRATTLPRDGGEGEMSMEGSSEGPLKDMRKGRARGPKKRRGAGEAGAGAGAEDAGADETVMAAPQAGEVEAEKEAPLSVPAVKLRAPVGSMAALMAASLEKAAATQAGGPASQKPVTSAKPSVAFEEWEAQKAAKPAKRTAAFGQAEEEREGLKPATPAKSSSTFAKVEEREMQKPAAPATPSAALAKQEEREGQKPATPAKSLAFSMKPSRTAQEPPKSDNAKPARATHEPIESNVPNFKGFGWNNRAAPTPKPEDNKENSDETLPSVKSAASFWGRQPPPKKADAPPQILLPSQRDEEAAMRSAGLLASSHTGSSSRDGSSNGLGISVEKRGGGSQATPPGSAGLPPRPVKSSRAVSGQLGEASVNKGVPRLMAVARPSTTAEKLLVSNFGAVPTSNVPLMIDTRALMSEEQGRPATEVKTLRRTTQEILPDGSVVTLRQQEQYTLFDESVYVCTYTYLTATSTKQTQLFIWSGSAASHSALSHAQKTAKTQPSTLPLQTITQGHEPAPFLQALGGILITRRSSRLHATKQYILCGRQHLGHIVFDEVDFVLDSLCAGFVFLISYPVTLQRTELYLWKGAACAMEEVCAARLVGMEISEMGGIEEVEQGGEDPKFLGIFGVGAVREGIAESSAMWEGKARAPGRFEIRLYRVEEVVQKVSLFAGLLSRRPSWNSRPPPSTRSASQDGADIKVEAKRISPFTQTDLEAEGIYVLDAYTKLYILIGPLFPSVPERVRDVLFAQTLRFAEELAGFRAEEEGWADARRGHVVFSGVPKEVKMLFRCWDEGRGLWGTAGLMAGSRGTRGDEVMMVRLDEVVRAVCK